MKHLLPLVLILTGCFDSLVSSACEPGYTLLDGRCAARPDDPGGDGAPDAPRAPDGGVVVHPPDGPEPATCTLPELACDGGCRDVSSDPDNCGACNRVCASGICTAGHCAGELSGHIIGIGHDYTSHRGAMERLLGNAAALGASFDVGVARWRGTSASAAVAGASTALARGMSQIGRPWHSVLLGQQPTDAAFAGVDVLLVDAQVGNGDAVAAHAAPWAAAIDRFLQRGGVVVVLEGAGGVSHRFAAAANVYAVPAPADGTGVPATVAAPGDALAQHVLSPYLAEASSVVYVPAPPGAVIATPAGTVAFHTTRY
ncbi:MAG: hypothetical protein KIT31_26735 [Deltaproteobacteria bacterium]|nr:hypothetical protein [Deltaproteobacteria bacterium]